MELRDKVVVVTGGANGIGRAMARRFAAEGARGIAVADLDAEGAAMVADEIVAAGGTAFPMTTDVSVEGDIVSLVERTTDTYGPIDLFCSNAGIAIGGGVDVPDEQWQRIWDINLMAHVWAARAVLPQMIARGEGYLLNTCSAAGLLSNIGAAPYTVTKHAAVALAEWLAITHGDQGIRVSALCPQGVRTNMLKSPGGSALLGAGALEPEDVAEVVVQGLREERFLILPHPEVADYVRRKAEDVDRWLGGMRKWQARVSDAMRADGA